MSVTPAPCPFACFLRCALRSSFWIAFWLAVFTLTVIAMPESVGLFNWSCACTFATAACRLSSSPCAQSLWL
jgi:hypothetical protein